ncbi:MAG: ABC transporter ATP-binding protein [Candidatus Eiseniibacteriota bacterium]|jgi:ATP-binding cassette subfamily B protein
MMPRLMPILEPLTATWRDAARFVFLLRRFRTYLRPQLGPLGIAIAASLGYMLATLAEPWPLQVVFDGVLLGRPVELLGFDLTRLAGERATLVLAAAAAAVLLLAALRGQLYYTQNVRSALAGQDVVMAVRRELFHHLQTLSLSFHHRAQSGDLLMRLTGDIVMLREMMIAALVTLLSEGLVVIGILIIMATLNVRLTLVACLVVPVLFIVLSVFRLRLTAAAGQQRKREGRLASRAHQILGAIQVVQAFTAEKHEDEQFKEMNKRSLRSGVKLKRLEAQLNRSVQLSIAAGICLILWLGSQDVLAGHLSPGELLVFLAYVRGLYRPLRQMSKLTQRMAKASACADRVLEVLDREPDVEDPADPVVLRRTRGRITFRGVDFAYRGGRPVLTDIDLDIAPHTMVALVGPTGAGKTTLLSLIPRFHDPIRGEVQIDGVPLRSIRLKSLRRQISFLPQDATVMGISIAENIAYGAIGRRGPPADREEIERAARAAHAHRFILRQPRGYDTIVGERGVTLSGGQRQRIAIARALLRDAPVLLLDEPVTGLDPLAGQAVLEALDALTRERTTVVIAHHLTTILRADRIVFLERGRIVETGTHAELLARGGAYAAFFESEWGTLSSHAGKPVTSAPGDAREEPV